MLIRCPECGKEISDKAASCPACGCPQSVWAGETKGERIATPSCATVRNDRTEERQGGQKAAFPFIVARFDGSHVTCVCQKCGTAVEYSRTDVQLPGWKVCFPRGLKCPDCGNEIENGSYYMTANPWQQSGGELLPIPMAGKEGETRAVASTTAQSNGPPGASATTADKRQEPPKSESAAAASDKESGEKKGGCLRRIIWITGTVIVCFLLLLAVVGAAVSGRQTSTRTRAPSISRTQQTESTKDQVYGELGIPTPTASMPSASQFGDDAESIVKEIKEAMGDYKYSWYANGYTLSLTIKAEELSGDDLADLYAADPIGTQDAIDQVTESMRRANSSTWMRFQTLGYSKCLIAFSMVTSDGMTICSAENGKITHTISADNFRYG